MEMQPLTSTALGPRVQLKMTDLDSGNTSKIASGSTAPLEPFYATKTMQVELTAAQGEVKASSFVLIVRKLCISR